MTKEYASDAHVREALKKAAEQMEGDKENLQRLRRLMSSLGVDVDTRSFVLGIQCIGFMVSGVDTFAVIEHHGQAFRDFLDDCERRLAEDEDAPAE